LGTSTPQEGREYFRDLGKHKKDFIWEDELDGNAIELAFRKKMAEHRKTWIHNFEVWFLPICDSANSSLLF
jgi:DNA topoisomerase-2